MYTGTMIEDLITTVERAEGWTTTEPAESPREDADVPVAYLLEQSYGEQLVKVA